MFLGPEPQLTEKKVLSLSSVTQCSHWDSAKSTTSYPKPSEFGMFPPLTWQQLLQTTFYLWRVSGKSKEGWPDPIFPLFVPLSFINFLEGGLDSMGCGVGWSQHSQYKLQWYHPTYLHSSSVSFSLLYTQSTSGSQFKGGTYPRRFLIFAVFWICHLSFILNDFGLWVKSILVNKADG